MIESIIFDFDGVIADSEGVWDRADLQFLANHGIEADKHFIKTYLIGNSIEQGAVWMSKYFDFGGDPKLLAQERFDLVEKEYKNLPLKVGFLEFYEKVRSKYKTAIGTALSKELFEHADNTHKLRDMFSGHVYFIEDVGFKAKPDPAVFLYAAEKLGSIPENCLVIEDAPHGLAAAKAAGMTAVGLVGTFDSDMLNRADFIANSFEDLLWKKLLN